MPRKIVTRKSAAKKPAAKRPAAKKSAAKKRADGTAAARTHAAKRAGAQEDNRWPRIGAHVSTAGSIEVAVQNALSIGAEAVQIFAAAPQQWRRKQHAPEAIAAFRQGMDEAGIGPNFIHGIYLTNLATEDQTNLEKGIESLTADLRLASDLGIAGVIFHVGSHKGAGFETMLPQIAEAMRRIVADSPKDAWLCIENNAGTGASVGSTWEEIGAIMDAVGSDRVKVCIDTCHAFSSGYDLTDPQGLEEAMARFDREIGLANLVAVHANDSKTPFGSGKDRHENIGQGSIGKAGFRNVLTHSAFRRLPFLLEVPGFGGGGPDAKNVKILKKLRDEAVKAPAAAPLAKRSR